MRARDQAIGAITLAIAMYYGVLRIAEAKCDAAVGSSGLLITEKQPEDFAAFEQLKSQLAGMGQGGLASRLEELRQKRELWIAPGLGPDRWAAYVESLGMVRRIYIRRVALLNPVAHLYPAGASDIPPDYQATFAWLSLGGAMRHELAHRDGAIAEADAYRIELAWYEEVRSGYVASLEGDQRRAWDWAVESATLSAQKAAQRAGAAVS